MSNIKSYAVIRDNRVVTLTATREEARVKKAKMGGKEKGVSIIQLVAKQEVRQNGYCVGCFKNTSSDVFGDVHIQVGGGCHVQLVGCYSPFVGGAISDDSDVPVLLHLRDFQQEGLALMVHSQGILEKTLD